MTDDQIVQAVRRGTHTLVPMPIGHRKFFIGAYADADIADDAYVLILDLDEDQFEGEDVLGCMMGGLTSEAGR